MTRLYFIRHGENDFALRGAIAGRQPGVHLNQTGHAQSERIADGLRQEGIERIVSSPLERCRETAEPLARRIGTDIELADELLELDFGQWTGRTFAELDACETWHRYNRFRSGTRIPGGELMLETQTRVVGFVQDLCARTPEGKIALFTHGDVIRSALLFYLGMSLDFVHRLTVDMGSVNIVNLYADGVEVEAINRVFPPIPARRP
jgi:broad specificity phosphatase PhoE